MGDSDKNNMMAYLVNESSDRVAQMNGWNSLYASNTQHQFWWIWNTWLEANDLNDGYWSGNDSGYKENVWEDYDESKTYTTSLYYFDVEFGEYNSTDNLMDMGFGPQYTDWGDGQNIVVTGDPPPAEPKIKIPVTKVWDDYGNSDKRPTSVTAILLANDIDTGKTIELSESNGWKGEFTELDKNDENGDEIIYRVEEVAPEGYVPDITGNATDGFVITNSRSINIPVKKVWDDTGYEDKRPELVTVKLFADGIDTGKTIELKAENEWKGQFSYLNLKDEKGLEISYTIQEIPIPGYTSTITGNVTSGYTITNKINPISVKVKKEWADKNNASNIRPNSISVRLLANKEDTGKKIVLNAQNGWSGSFDGLHKYDKGTEIKYTVEEIEKVEGYTTYVEGSEIKGFVITNTLVEGASITNKHDPDRIKIDVIKKWNDDLNDNGHEDFDEYRPDEIEVTLYAIYANDGKYVKVTEDADGNTVTNPIKLNKSNNWSHTFTELFRYRHVGIPIEYKVEETPIYTEPDAKGVIPYSNPHYDIQTIAKDSTKLENKDAGNKIITITNTHEPEYDYEYIEIKGTVWMDGEGGKANEVNGIMGDKDIEKKLSGIKVTLRDAKGNQFDETSTAITDQYGNYTIKVNYDHRKDVFKLHSDIKKVAEKLETAYVEFEYDGMLYTTVHTDALKENTSKAKEDEVRRKQIDEWYYENFEVTPPLKYQLDENGIKTIKYPESEYWETTIKANTSSVMSFKDYNFIEKDVDRTELLKYCNGNGTYIRTNPELPWMDILEGTNDLACNSGKGHAIDNSQTTVKIKVINNVNLGLFRREQPNVAIFTDLDRVKVSMNGQEYTYKYGVKGIEGDAIKEKDGIKAKFQNKGTYTYKRPVNPADIAAINDPNYKERLKSGMDVEVTYKITFANLSSTLPIVINDMTNYFDQQYTLVTEPDKWKVDSTGDYNSAKNKNDLGIRIAAEEEKTIELTYKVSQNAIKGLLAEQATLNYAAEIDGFKVEYGSDTLYAEEGKNGRTGWSYAGYDFDSHPGNAVYDADPKYLVVEPIKRLHINDDKRLTIDNIEDDEDIAPSFVLVRDEKSKTFKGTIWEDKDVITTDKERLGDGIMNDGEIGIPNVKIELCQYQADGKTIDVAPLYNGSTDNPRISEPAVTYTSDSMGNFSLTGIVTGEEYLVRYTYGDDTTVMEKGPTQIVGKEISVRDYKSTIIAEEDINLKSIFGIPNKNLSEVQKTWPVTHNDNNSIAVDYMIDRLKVSDLKYGTYGVPDNMTAYSKLFITPVEFDDRLGSDIDASKRDGNEILGAINDKKGIEITETLEKFDFGIIERPREDLIAQKTITNFKITLANGQELTGGNPTDPNANINYAKILGFRQTIQKGIDAQKAPEKLVSVEIDKELIQGAKLDVEYEIKIINNNEIDYDYGVNANYTDIAESVGEFISSSKMAKYYYFGNKDDLSKIETEIKVVDYLNREFAYEKEENLALDDTDKSTILNTEGFISNESKTAIDKYGYKVLKIKNNIKVKCGETSDPIKMKVYKTLSNKDKNSFDNNIEIIQIDGKTARKVKAIQYEPEYKDLEVIPGNYEPKETPKEKREPDDDTVNIVISPPTGETNYIITYITTALAGLVVIFIGIIFIKKKVLNK